MPFDPSPNILAGYDPSGQGQIDDLMSINPEWNRFGRVLRQRGVKLGSQAMNTIGTPLGAPNGIATIQSPLMSRVNMAAQGISGPSSIWSRPGALNSLTQDQRNEVARRSGVV